MNEDDEKPTNIRRGLIYAEQNLMAAKIILEDVEKYGGEDSAMVRWARKTVEKCTPQ